MALFNPTTLLPEELERFWSKVKKTETCWLWTGGTDAGGYGHFVTMGEHGYAHRISYRLCVGKIPDGLCICHRCDVPTCVNPDHLFAASQSENNQDRAAKKRSAKRLGKDHHMVKLTEEQVREIRRRSIDLPKGGARKLAKEFGVTPQNICNVVKRRSWAWVD